MTSSSSAVARLLTGLALLIPLSAACSSAAQPAGNADASMTRDAGRGNGDTGTSGAECGTGNSCSGGATCFFPIGACTSKGQCIVWPAPGASECRAIEEFCGCDGTLVTSGCDAPSGFATGPTTGTQSICPTPTADGGSTPVPCGAENSCPGGGTCFFPIGECSATGQCIVWPAPGTGECKAIEELCGCDGSQVQSGCIAPSGYATGPTTGTCTPDAGHLDGSPGHLDGSVGHLDGSVSATSCAQCGADELCLVNIQVGGAVATQGDGGIICHNGGSGPNCTHQSFGCANLPASCGGTPTCGCASQLCSDGYQCTSADSGLYTSGGPGPILVCEQEDA